MAIPVEMSVFENITGINGVGLDCYRLKRSLRDFIFSPVEKTKIEPILALYNVWRQDVHAAEKSSRSG